LARSDPITRPIVIALGGNAIARPREEGNIAQQFAHTRETAEHIAALVQAGYLPVLTHGNGPQVGNVMRRVEIAAGEIYPIPLHVCVADTQAGMGYMIGECLENALAQRGIARRVTTIITRVEVDPNDPACADPTKPIGRFLPRAQAEDFMAKYGWAMKEFEDDRFRRVVASPPPLRILEIDLIRRLVEAGEILVVAGGGGVPVARQANGGWHGIDCVVDKDRSTALLATQLGVETLLIATGVRQVMLDFGKPTARGLARMTASEARRHAADGHFPPGTLGPKIEAALDFLDRAISPAARVVITDLENMTKAVAGTAGTTIVRD